MLITILIGIYLLIGFGILCLINQADHHTKIRIGSTIGMSTCWPIILVLAIFFVVVESW